MPVQPNKAVVGSNAFAHSSGIHQDGVLKEKKTYEIMTPRSVGLKENRMNLTSRSGKHMVHSRLQQLGYAEKEINIDSFYEKFIALADKKGTVYDDDLITLIELEETAAFEEIFVLDYLDVSSGKDVIPTATVRLRANGTTMQEAACGDGPVDAMTKAIDRVIGFNIAIESFSLDSITQGREALGKVRISGRVQEGVFNGIGSSTDIIEASAEAYMEVANKIARLRKHRKGASPRTRTRKNTSSRGSSG
jgi:2-isopropylmalate synthase